MKIANQPSMIVLLNNKGKINSHLFDTEAECFDFMDESADRLKDPSFVVFAQVVPADCNCEQKKPVKKKAVKKKVVKKAKKS